MTYKMQKCAKCPSTDDVKFMLIKGKKVPICRFHYEEIVHTRLEDENYEKAILNYIELL